MSQHDFDIANQTFPLTRADFNLGLKALASNSSGATEPSTTFAHQFWYDTTTDLLKMRDTANTGWITLAYFDVGNGQWELRSDVIQAVSAAGVTIKDSGGTALLAVAASGQITVTGTIDGLAAAAAKVTPVDADHVTILDSAAANILKKVTWANIKATLKTYFDTLYAAYATTTTNGPVELATTVEGDAGTSTTLVPAVDVVKSMIATHIPNIAADDLSTNGYVTLPNGLILQWGKVSTTTWTFPIAFPTACVFVSVTADRTASTTNGADYANTLTTTSANIVPGSLPAWVFSIGY